jgi:hypothetical protein
MATRGTAANGPSTTTEDELDFELVTSPRQLGSAPALRKEAVTVTGWLTASGKAARLMVWELTALDYSDFIEEGRTYKDGALVAYDSRTEDVRFLAWCIRDQNNNRLWPRSVEAEQVLGSLGRTTLNVLMAAANRVNRSREASTGGNSSEVQSDS